MIQHSFTNYRPMGCYTLCFQGYEVTIEHALSWQHMSYLQLTFVGIRRCSDILKRQKYFHGNKERSEKSLILVVFKLLT